MNLQVSDLHRSLISGEPASYVRFWERDGSRSLFEAFDGVQTAGRQARVDIKDVDAALQKVRHFVALLERSHRLYMATGVYGDHNQVDQSYNQINEAFPLILRIAARADARIASQLIERDIGGWPYYTAKAASLELAGVLDSVEETQRILGPVGPKLAAASLHQWIWNAAVGLWDDGHLREAVQAAATVLFDSHLPAKLGVPPKPSAKDIAAQAFSTDPPTAGSPRLRLVDFPDPSPSWTSQHEGARFLGMGCAQLIRNLTTHGSQPDEQTALEQLAALSLLARAIEQAKVVTV